ncbi:MAG: signal recognition particle-docking protein FtsY [Nanoarchaeota archaeon]|nr:signal recognition particle-docking protein FtsY [Nanoarchaeota archaeon]
MFGKLKDKLKSWVNKVSKDEEKEEENQKTLEETKEKSKKSEKTKKEKKKESKNKQEILEREETETISELIEEDIDKKLKGEIQKEEYKEPPMKYNEGKSLYDPDIEKIEEIVKEKKKQSLFKKLTSGKRTFTEKDFEEYSEELEMLLLENNVALEVVDKVLEYLKKDLIDQEVGKKELEEKVKKALKEVIEMVLVEPFDLIEKIKEKKEKPFVILFCGINGTGKTTTIAKLVNLFKKNKMNSVIAAGDTFRAASIEQLKKHGDKLDTKVMSSDYGADPAAVGFDAIKYAEKNKLDVVLIDTAGRMHTAKNLLREMEKIKKVCKPDLTIFVGESTTGNDSTDQVKAFDEEIGIDAIILSKADVDEKGGTALSVGYTTNKPIIYLGTGQEYEKLEKFDKKNFIEKLGL